MGGKRNPTLGLGKMDAILRHGEIIKRTKEEETDRDLTLKLEKILEKGRENKVIEEEKRKRRPNSGLWKNL